MILQPFEVRDSLINRAGKGIFLLTPVEKGSVIIYPDNIPKVYSRDEIAKFTPGTLEHESCVRWFENYYSVSPEWSDECYINHSFEPNAMWFLGFAFALRDIASGEELTIDYTFIADENVKLDFIDAATGREVAGVPWKETMRRACKKLLELID